jgi:predicted metalloprotease with PDZ domain
LFGKKDPFGVVLDSQVIIKEVSPKSVAAKEGNLRQGDVVRKINGERVKDLSLREADSLLNANKDTLDITVKRKTDKEKNSPKNDTGKKYCICKIPKLKKSISSLFSCAESLQSRACQTMLRRWDANTAAHRKAKPNGIRWEV